MTGLVQTILSRYIQLQKMKGAPSSKQQLSYEEAKQMYSQLWPNGSADKAISWTQEEMLRVEGLEGIRPPEDLKSPPPRSLRKRGGKTDPLSEGQPLRRPVDPSSGQEDSPRAAAKAKTKAAGVTDSVRPTIRSGSSRSSPLSSPRVLSSKQNGPPQAQRRQSPSGSSPKAESGEGQSPRKLKE